MKGLISGIKRMEIHDGDGLRTTVFFKGCPLKCIWCHNPESISFEKQIAFFDEKCIKCGFCKNERTGETANICPAEAIIEYGKEYDLDELVSLLSEDELFFKNSRGGVTLSGGECLMQADFVIGLAKKLFFKNISVYVDTCGFVKQDIFDSIIPYTDKFLYDIKAIDSEKHIKFTGQDNKIILDNLKYLSENGCQIEIRYPLVKGYNDTECNKIGKFLEPLNGITKVKVLKYHNFAGSRYEALGMVNTLPVEQTTDSDLKNAVNILKTYGLNAVL